METISARISLVIKESGLTKTAFAKKSTFRNRIYLKLHWEKVCQATAQ